MERWKNLNGFQKVVLILSIVMLLVFSVLYLIHKGSFLEWFGGALFCVITIVSILFADELFRLRLVLRVQDVDLIEPSDWEIASRYIAWVLMTIMAFVVYMMGLQ